MPCYGCVSLGRMGSEVFTHSVLLRRLAAPRSWSLSRSFDRRQLAEARKAPEVRLLRALRNMNSCLRRNMPPMGSDLW